MHAHLQTITLTDSTEDLRQVLHDWPDLEAKMILGKLHSAMTPGYSRLLIDDFIVNDELPGPDAVDDVAMMILLSGKSRTAKEW